MRERKPKQIRDNKKAYRGLVKIGKYLYVYMPSHPNAIQQKRYIALHRLILEWKVRRRLTNEEVTHHLNGNTFDNHPDNLKILTAKEHNKLTANGRKKDSYGKFTKAT